MLFSLSVGKEENTAEIRSLECLEVEATVLTPQFPVAGFLRYCVRITYPIPVVTYYSSCLLVRQESY
jgi:hypothetical protein